MDIHFNLVPRLKIMQKVVKCMGNETIFEEETATIAFSVNVHLNAPGVGERLSLISALKVLMKSCRFWSWKTGPQRQVEHEEDTDRINE